MVAHDEQREVNQNASGAKKAAAHGPFYITDRGRPAHVLLSCEDYERLVGTEHVLNRLADPAGVEDIELFLPASDEPARPAEFG